MDFFEKICYNRLYIDRIFVIGRKNYMNNKQKTVCFSGHRILHEPK